MNKISFALTNLAAVLCLAVCSAHAQLPEPDGGTIERGVLPTRWLSEGLKCMEIPEWQVHEYNPNFFLLRQSPCTDYEKPVVFLFFGKDKAMLIDTGSRKGNLAPSLQWVVKNWLARNGRTSIPLLVVHTHEHGDHIAGDAALQAMNDPAIPVTFLAPTDLEAAKRFYGITNWPTDIGHIDLGGRMIDVIPIPGHSALSIAFYDRRTAILLSGDTLYPGRLYVQDFAAFQASTERLIEFTKGKPVAHILGNHIEETNTPFLDYPVGTIYQPNEHELALSRGSLLELEDALLSMHGVPQRMALRDFSVWPSGRQFAKPGDKEKYEKHAKEEKEKMWEHSLQ
ncbi:MBL fold metallo-hydrolase [Granulicella mallensis]|uniref:Beta-lactamase domain protein n=1 Tax=Granulicella mallensis (strain ATCC BAA-1857 / DSM 23137 / MP5ACTX8) TaxID=682795 RepID=G8NW85_GRAMM|nr:MBL fold metallo-hydrolase [Granulicella mallensis]AEU36597.1 beta-lactamase domain protein [Granulicella mallensis MP5ACTX8]